MGLAKAAFWKNKELMRRNIRFKTKLKILNTYVFSVPNYGYESWTWNAAMYKKVDAFEMWCYRSILKRNWFDGVSKCGCLEPNTYEIAFQGRYYEEENGLCGTCINGL